MKSCLTVPLPDEMVGAPVQSLFSALGAHNLRFVGGCVRNIIMGEPICDLDFATLLVPDEVIRCLKKAKISYVPTGIQYGTVTAVIAGCGYEITTLRRDVCTDGRHAEVDYGTSWDEDAQRRDFTCNALYADLDGRVYDPLGSGVDDARARRIRFVGDPAVRIQEDYLRILRFFRFYALYGKGAMDKKALAACSAHREGLERLSKERITQEMVKLILSDRAGKTLTLMVYEGVFPALLPKNFDPERFGILVRLQKVGTCQSDDALLAARILVLADFNMTYITRMFNGMIVNKKIQSMVMVFFHVRYEIKRIDSSKISDLLYRFGRPLTRMLIDVMALRMDITLDEHRTWVADADGLAIPVFPVKGKDLLAKGLEAGPEIGDILADMEKRWIKSGFRLTKRELLLWPLCLRGHGH